MAEEPDAMAAVAANMKKNFTLNAINEILQTSGEKPEVQMGILALAQSLAFRRLLAANNISERGKRLVIMRQAVRDIEHKLREFGVPVEQVHSEITLPNIPEKAQ